MRQDFVLFFKFLSDNIIRVRSGARELDNGRSKKNGI